jgi:hypothetical protein
VFRDGHQKDREGLDSSAVKSRVRRPVKKDAVDAAATELGAGRCFSFRRITWGVVGVLEFLRLAWVPSHRSLPTPRAKSWGAGRHMGVRCSS